MDVWKRRRMHTPFAGLRRGRSFAFPPWEVSQILLQSETHAPVCPLSREGTLNPLSVPLRNGVRFWRCPGPHFRRPSLRLAFPAWMKTGFCHRRPDNVWPETRKRFQSMRGKYGFPSFDETHRCPECVRAMDRLGSAFSPVAVLSVEPRCQRDSPGHENQV